MLQFVLEVAVPTVTFAVGVYVGRKFPATVDHAIAVIQSAEHGAKATLDKITAHKAS